MSKARKSDSYGESDAPNVEGTPRPFLAPGIGRRIGEAADRLGSRGKAFAVMEISSAALQRYIKEENSASFEAVARLCMAAGVRMEWIATGDGPSLASEATSLNGSQPLRLEGLTIAIQLAAEALEGKYLPPDKYAELVSLIYEGLEEGLPEATILRFARIAKPD